VLHSGKSKKKTPSTALNLPRVLPWHSGKSSPSARFLALGEELFPVRSIPGSSSPSVALGEGFPECFLLFPECFRHSGKQAAAVVRLICRAPIWIWILDDRRSKAMAHCLQKEELIYE
jgi:hypothetical protein